jgi:hypothetical protein
VVIRGEQDPECLRPVRPPPRVLGHGPR